MLKSGYQHSSPVHCRELGKASKPLPASPDTYTEDFNAFTCHTAPHGIMPSAHCQQKHTADSCQQLLLPTQ